MMHRDRDLCCGVDAAEVAERPKALDSTTNRQLPVGRRRRPVGVRHGKCRIKSSGTLEFENGGSRGSLKHRIWRGGRVVEGA